MVRKLIAWDLKVYRSQLKLILPIYGLILLSSFVLNRLRIPYLAKLSEGLAGIAVYLLIPGLVLLSLVHYYRHLYTHQGYLSHTLPVRPDQRYHAKLISAFLLYVLGTIGVIAGAMLIYLMGRSNDPAALSRLWQAFRLWPHHYGIKPLVFWLLLIGGWLYLFIMPFILYSFSITLGMSRRLSRYGVGGPVLVYLVSYLALQLLMVIGYLFIPLSLRLRAVGTGYDWQVVKVMPFHSLVELFKLGRTTELDVALSQLGGRIDFGLGIFVVMFGLLLAGYIRTRQLIGRVDLR